MFAALILTIFAFVLSDGLFIYPLMLAALSALPVFDKKHYAGTFVFNTTNVEKDTVTISYDSDLDELYSKKEVTFRVINED